MKRAFGKIIDKTAALLLCAALVMLCGCKSIGKKTDDKDADSDATLVLESDEAESQLETVVLYFPGTEDPEKLYAEYRGAIVTSTTSLVDVAIEELLEGPNDPDHTSVIPEGVRLIQTEQSSSLVTVHLSSELLELDDRQLLLAKLSIVNTLTSISGVEYVTVMCEEKEISIQGYTSGPEGMYIGTLEEKWQEIESAVATGTSKKTAVLYFQDSSGSYLLPEVCTLTIGSNAAESIYNALLAGPVNTVRCSPVVSDTCKLLEAPATQTLADGSVLLTINFASDDAFWEASFGDRMLRMGGIVLSLTSYMTDIDYVSIEMDGQPVNSYVYETGYLEASIFRNLVGDSVTLYFPDASNSALIEVQRTVDQSTVGRAREILKQLFKGPQDEESSKAQSLPLALSSTDILGIRIQNGLVILNMTRDSVERLFELDKEEQFMTVFAIVNTLCEIEGITRVQFLAEGRGILSGGRVSLENPLLPNVGLVY